MGTLSSLKKPAKNSSTTMRLLLPRYREAGTWVKSNISSVVYESSVRITPEGYVVFVAMAECRRDYCR